jgi:hypothetical protein
MVEAVVDLHHQALVLLAELLGQLGRELVAQHRLQVRSAVEPALARHPGRREALLVPERFDTVRIGPARPRGAGQPGRKGPVRQSLSTMNAVPPGRMTRANSARPGSQPGPKK